MKLSHLIVFTLASFCTQLTLNAHCQVPCGIYGDALKFGELEQHVETIIKAGKQIREISAKDPISAQDRQQIIRWTSNKESHAQTIVNEVADYFLAQRIKPDAEHYAEKLECLHHIVVYSMKSKQSVESEPARILEQKIAAFKKLYLVHEH